MPAQQGNNLSISQIRDGLINPNFTTPLYVSANSFTVAGDVTSWLRPGRGLVITFQTSGIKRCIATSLSYNSGTDKTTINTVGDSLVNETITSVLLSLSDLEGSLIAQKRITQDPNLVLYLSFEEGTGTMTKDLSGWGNHGTLVNGPTWSTGRAGKCLSFDGVDDYVNCGSSSSLSAPSQLTVEAWFNPSNFPSGLHQIVGKQTYYNEYRLVLDGNDLQGHIFSSSTGYVVKSSSSGVYLTTNIWYHAIMTYDGTTFKLYLNGNLVDSLNISITINPNSNSLTIGTNNDNDYFFPGLIDEVRIYNRALTASEIQDHYLNP